MGDVVVMYEVWSLSEYLHTVIAVVDVKCKVKISKKIPHSALRLIPRDDVFVSADASSLYFYTGDSAGGRVVRTMIALKDGSGKVVGNDFDISILNDDHLKVATRRSDATKKGNSDVTKKANSDVTKKADSD